MMSVVAPVGARILLLVALLAAVFPGWLRGAAADYEGKRIARILFDPALQPLPDQELAELLPVKADQPLRLRDLRNAITRLFATGRYIDVSVDAEADSEDVTLTFITRSTWFVGAVSVEGVPEPPNRGELVNATGLQLGEEFTEDKALAAIGNIQKVLVANGFHEAQVERFVEYQAAFSQVNVLFMVTPGPRATLSAPIIEGASADEVRKIIKATKWERFWVLRGWKKVQERRVQQGLERIRDYYQKRNFLLSAVSLGEMRYDPVSHSVVPTITVSPGPQVRIETSGQDVSRGRLRKLVPIYQEQAVDRDLLVEGSRNLTEHFQAKGYFDTTVAFRTEEESPDEETIEYLIDTGERYKLRGVEISGNEYFDDATLRERMAITPATWIRYRHGRYSEVLLNQDLAAITALYRSSGFRDVRVTARTETPGDGRQIDVYIEVDEGRQWLVSDLDIQGVSEDNLPYVRSLASSFPGQPFSEANIATDRDNILSFYYNNGYLDARFDWETEEEVDSKTARVKMIIQEGPQQFVRASLIGGLKDTNPELVYSRIHLGPGDPLSQSAMVETQRRLYDLGIFARVEQAIQNPGGVEKRKYLLHQFEEARRYSVNFGLGAQIARIGSGNFTDFNNPAGSPGFSPRISVGVTRSNMFGFGHTAGVQARVSDIRQRALVSYLAPQFKGRESLSLNVIGLYDFSRDINTFESTRWQGTVQFRHRISRANSFRYRFTYRRVDTAKIKISPELIPIFAQPVRVGLAAVDFVQDRRDDPLDSTRGYYNAIETALASKIFGSQTDYIRIIGRNSSYHRIGKDLVFARSFTLGWMPNTASDPTQSPIPLPERIFSGGASSHRGFPDNQAGRRDLETGFPVGGRALLMNNLELRFPLIGDHLGGVLFLDSGNVYTTFGDISFRFRQRDKEDFDYMVHSAGFGIRYNTPIGPVRLDLGFSPNSPRFFGFEGTLEDLITGGGRKVDQRINQFQFFFSIGQTF